MRIALALAVSGLLLLGVVAPGAWAQNQLEVARQLRVEWDRGSDKWGPPRLVGYVYNDSTFRIGSVRLRVETLDGADRVVAEALAWIYVNVPARDRAYFSVRRPSGGETFRLTVESFVLIAREAPEQTP
jgi:hypothetical protein